MRSGSAAGILVLVYGAPEMVNILQCARHPAQQSSYSELSIEPPSAAQGSSFDTSLD